MSAILGYAADEWETLLRLPQAAAVGVIFSGQTGPVQLIQEARVLSAALRAATRSPSPLVAAIAEELGKGRDLIQTQEDHDEISVAERTRRMRADTLEDVKLASSILEAKATRSEAEAYKRWVLDLARTTAEAAKEGGFLGIGGARVTHEEQTTLDALAAALGISR